MSLLIPVILCGGAGSRLWPASRETYPKQLFSFGGGHSLFQDTIQRVSGAGYGRPIIVTGHDYRFLVAEQLRALGLEADILLEPMRRDSCAAIAAASAHAAGRDPGALLLILAADHAIPDRESFAAHTRLGIAAAQARRIVTFGIRPSQPATGYGYIQPGAAIAGLSGVNAIASFVEKPDAATARAYVEAGYLWNSGNFLFRADVFLDELKRLAPDIHGPASRAALTAMRDLDFLRLDPAAFAEARATSIDYAVMEKTALAAVVPSDFTWSDIGSWSAIWDMAEKDNDGNAATGDVVFQSASGCYAYSPHMLTTVAGVENLVVVTTRDAVLVTSRDRPEEVKALVGHLSRLGRREAVDHLKVYRPWGDHEMIDKGARYQVKRITVKPGARIALQSHAQRAEHWVVVSGTAKATVGDETRILAESQSIFIPAGTRHRLENPGDTPLELIEVQSGIHLGEDDIQRHENPYGET